MTGSFWSWYKGLGWDSSRNREDVISKADFYKSIKPLVRPGDVINFDGHAPWYKVHYKIAYWGIRRHQKRLFGRLGRWRDTHTELYLDDDHVFSVEPPQRKWHSFHSVY